MNLFNPFRAHPTRRAVRRYLAAVRPVAPGLSAASTDDDLVRMGASLVALAAASDDGLADAIATVTEHGADRAEVAKVYTVAALHLGPVLLDGKG